jgi:hypothetical protein
MAEGVVRLKLLGKGNGGGYDQIAQTLRKAGAT